MNFKSKFIGIIAVLFSLSIFLQVTRLNGYMKTKENISIDDINSMDTQDADPDIISHIKREKNLIVYSDKFDTYTVEKDNFSKVFGYMQKDYDSIDISEFQSKDLSMYSNIILMIGKISELGDYDKLFKYVNNGGKILFANRLESIEALGEISEKLGINDIKKDDIKSTSVKLLENLMIKSKGVEIKDDPRVENIVCDVTLKNSVKKYITGYNNIPILWSNKYGSGEIYYFNGNMFREKSSRGLIAGIISDMNGFDIYPIINAKINFLDDYPSPIPDGTNEVIDNEYGESINEFYKNHWWPDMVKVAAINNIKYTGMFIGSYDDEVNDLSKSKIDVKDGDFEYYARELISENGEIGLHGYNHQPLKMSQYKSNDEGYVVWPSKENMAEGIKKAVQYINDTLKNYKVNVYVPPSNIISEEGIKVLSQDTDIKVVCSIYDEDSKSDGHAQEFNIRKDGIIELPRITSGYFFTDDVKWDILNEINIQGYFSHFVHPDDVLDTERSKGGNWTDMIESYSKMQNYTNEEFPWVQSLVASEGANKLERYLNTNIYYQKNNDNMMIYCKNYSGPVDLILKSNNAVSAGENCTVRTIDENTYLVEVNSATSKVLLER